MDMEGDEAWVFFKKPLKNGRHSIMDPPYL